MIEPPAVTDLLAACPFLVAPLREVALLDDDDFALDTVVFGGTVRLIMGSQLPATQEAAVFDYFNALAERGGPHDLEILGTGAIELFNDDAAAQRLARRRLTGRALEMLESFRVSWGQPDYGPVE